MELHEIINGIKAPSEIAKSQAQKRLDSIAKPLGSLGLLEKNLVKIAGAMGTSKILLEKKCVVVMCADNGVVEEGVTQVSSDVTAIVTENFARGATSVNCMADIAGARVIPVDIGVMRDLTEDGVLKRKIAYGTKNMVKEYAMTREEATKAIMVGVELVGTLKAEGYTIIATGEMGIGNTTTSSAIAAVLMNAPVELVTGRGAGLCSDGLARKITAIKTAIDMHKPNDKDALDVLHKVGGLDIAGLVGVFLGGAYYGVPIVIDGFISSVSALVASSLCKTTREYMIASHISREPAGNMIIEELGFEPMVNAQMCLGEGTGAMTIFPMLDMITEVYNKMSTFSEINIDDYTPQV